MVESKKIGTVSSSVLWSVSDSIGQQALSLIIFMILARLLEPTVFGILAAALAFVFVLRAGLLTGVQMALITSPTPDEIEFDTAFWITLGLSVCGFALLNLSAPFLETAFQTEGIAIAVHSTSVMLIFAGLGYTHHAWVRLNYKFRILAVCNLAGVIAGGTGGIGLALLGFELTALIANQVLTGFAAIALLWLALSWRPSLRFSKKRSKRLCREALPLAGVQALQFAAQNFDTALVTYFVGPFSGGLYAASKRMVQAVYLGIWHPITFVALPTFAKLRADMHALMRAAVKTGGMAAAITFPIFALLGTISSELLFILFGPNWTEAAPILTVLALFGLVLPSIGVLQQLLIALDRSRTVLVLTTIQMMLAIGAVVIFAPANGTAFAVCLAAPSLAIYILTIFIVAKDLPFPLSRYLLAIARPLICVGFMVWAVIEFPTIADSPLANMLAKAAAGGSVYVLLLFLIARDVFDDVMSFSMAVFPPRMKPGENQE